MILEFLEASNHLKKNCWQFLVLQQHLDMSVNSEIIRIKKIAMFLRFQIVFNIRYFTKFYKNIVETSGFLDSILLQFFWKFELKIFGISKSDIFERFSKAFWQFQKCFESLWYFFEISGNFWKGFQQYLEVPGISKMIPEASGNFCEVRNARLILDISDNIR